MKFLPPLDIVCTSKMPQIYQPPFYLQNNNQILPEIRHYQLYIVCLLVSAIHLITDKKFIVTNVNHVS